MAFLQKIRNKPKLLIGIIAIALLAFIFPWSEVSSFINRQKYKAFEVNGDNISIEDYTRRVANFELFQKTISGQTSFDENTTLQIREFVYQQMVKEIMLDEQTLKLGINVTNEELNGLLYGPNPSPVLQQIPFFLNPQTRQLDPKAVANFATFATQNTHGVDAQGQDQIRTAKEIWDTIINLVKYTRLEEKYTGLLANSDIVNSIEINAAKEASTISSDIAYVLERYSNLPDSLFTIEKSEIEKLYNERKNNFQTTEAARKISYFTKEVTPSTKDYDVAFAQINEAITKLKNNENAALVVADYSEVPYQDVYYAQNKLSAEEAEFATTASIGEVYGPIKDSKAYKAYKLVDRTQAPDSVKLSIIFVPGDITNNSVSKADSIINVINGGKDFETVANELNPQSNGGLFGWVTEADLNSGGKEMVSTSFNTPIGQVAKVNIQGNTAIIKVDDKTAPVNKYKFAYVQIPVVISDETIMAVDNELNQFVAENTDYKTFVTKAREKGYNIFPNSMVYANYPNIAQIPNSRDVIRWAFTEKEGSIKKFEFGDYRIIASLDGKVDKGYLPISEVESSLKEEILKNKKADRIISGLKAKNLNTLQAYAQDLKTNVDTAKFVTFDTPSILGIGHESALNAYAEIAPLNKLEGPVQGNNGVIVAQVTSRVDNAKDFNVESFKQQKARQNYYLVMTQSMEILQQKMKVKDNRINLGF